MLAILTLYRRCKIFKTLPRKGGIFDQEESIMELFEFIESVVEECQSRRDQEKEGDVMKQKMMKGLPHG